MITTPRVPPPHIRQKRTSAQIMGDVCIALVPPMAAAVWYFGWAAWWRLLIAAAAALAASRISAKVPTADITAMVTGLLLGLSCPAQIPLWLLVGGCFFAVCVARDGYGGIGKNLFNPAMAARGTMLAIFPAYMTGYGLPDGVSAATPLAVGADNWSLLTGRVGGSMGETSTMMIVLGLSWLLIRRVVRWYIPLLSLAGFSAVMLLAGKPLIPQLLSGSILFGAAYIFTDYTTRPATAAGQCLFAAGAGALTAILRVYGIYPEGVCYAVLLMNVLAPLTEQITL